MSENDPRLEKALKTAHLGDIPRSIEMLEVFVEETPDQLDGWGHLGYLLYICGRVNEALPCYQKICELDPENAEAAERLGDCFLALGNRRSARGAYLSIQGKPDCLTDRVYHRLSIVEPVGKKILRNAGPIALRFGRRLRRLGFLRSLLGELVAFPRSLDGIRSAGGPAYVAYLIDHYLYDDCFEFAKAPCDFCGSTQSRPVFFYRSQKKIKCEDCGLEFVERKPPESLDVHADWYNQDSSVELMEENWRNEDFLRHRIEMLHKVFEDCGVPFPVAGARALEIGCAEGHFLKYLKDQGLAVEGIETGGRLVEYCRERFGLNVTRETIRGFDPSETNFDFIFAYHVAEHLEKPSELFAKAHEMLEPGGCLLVEVPTTDLASRSLLEQLDETHGYGNMGHMHYFRPETMSRYFPKHGFELLGSYEYHAEALPAGGFLGRKV